MTFSKKHWWCQRWCICFSETLALFSLSSPSSWIAVSATCAAGPFFLSGVGGLALIIGWRLLSKVRWDHLLEHSLCDVLEVMTLQPHTCHTHAHYLSHQSEKCLISENVRPWCRTRQKARLHGIMSSSAENAGKILCVKKRRGIKRSTKLDGNFNLAILLGVPWRQWGHGYHANRKPRERHQVDR